VRWAAVALVGCNTIQSPDDYAHLRAVAECKNIEKCERGFYDSEYSDFDDCVDTHTASLEDEHEVQVDVSDCVYDEYEAYKCVSLIRGFDCEDWAELEAFAACNLVYDCPGGFPPTYGGYR
jgi:hypothetical protein